MKKIILIDRNADLVHHWAILFQSTPSVEVHTGSIFDYEVDALVSPANSFGFMDGGIDYALSEVLGWELQRRLQKQIADLPEKELLVGRSLTLTTGHPKWPYLISAPTMRVPMVLGANSTNVYLAAKAVFNELKYHPTISSIAMSGMGTGVGKVPYDICAHQMRAAYDAVFVGKPYPTSWHDAQTRHQALYKATPRDLQKG